MRLTINGTQHALTIDPRTTLLVAFDRRTRRGMKGLRGRGQFARVSPLRAPTKILVSPPTPLRRPQPRP